MCSSKYPRYRGWRSVSRGNQSEHKKRRGQLQLQLLLEDRRTSCHRSVSSVRRWLGEPVSGYFQRDKLIQEETINCGESNYVIVFISEPHNGVMHLNTLQRKRQGAFIESRAESDCSKVESLITHMIDTFLSNMFKNVIVSNDFLKLLQMYKSFIASQCIESSFSSSHFPLSHIASSHFPLLVILHHSGRHSQPINLANKRI